MVFCANTTFAQKSKSANTLKIKNVYKQEKVDSIIKQINRIDSTLMKIDTLLTINNGWLEHIELDCSLKNRYKLYSTENIYTFLMLDTKTGMIEQIQWSLESSEEYCVTINKRDLTLFDGYGSNTFELYPTKNIYQFILINKTSGRKWHVQWGFDSKKRWIRAIY